MVDGSIIGEDPVVRVSAGGTNQPEGRELLHTARELDTSVTVAEVGSTGLVGLEPLVMGTLDGKTAFFPQCPIERIRTITEELDDGSLTTDDAMAVTEHDPETTTLPMTDDGPLGVGDRVVLRACGWMVPTSFEDYQSIRSTETPDIEQPDETMSRLRETNLRGRGRGDIAADAPIVDHWETARESDDDSAVVVNANEADPHAEMDRLLLESDPFAVLDAALAAARVVEASNVVVYLNKTDSLARDRISETAAVLMNEFDEEPPIEVLAGPDEYKAGEMTMAIEAIEGNHRLEARLRPPSPSVEGLYGRPTLIHTPRTLVQISAMLGDREELDVSSDPGTRLFTIAGDVSAPATIELSTDDDLTTAKETVDFDGQLKAACVGGVFGGLTQSLDVPARVNAITAAGLGTNGVIELFGDDQCIVSLVGNRSQFAAEENCGRCVPCREGTQQLTDLLRDIYDGSYESEKIRELTRVMENSSICQFGQEAQRPVTTAMSEFETEFRAHANGNCPTGTCN
jgi:NADH-quinone oxidoreductase subunit F